VRGWEGLNKNEGGVGRLGIDVPKRGVWTRKKVGGQGHDRKQVCTAANIHLSQRGEGEGARGLRVFVFRGERGPLANPCCLGDRKAPHVQVNERVFDTNPGNEWHDTQKPKKRKSDWTSHCCTWKTKNVGPTPNWTKISVAMAVSKHKSTKMSGSTKEKPKKAKTCNNGVPRGKGGVRRGENK